MILSILLDGTDTRQLPSADARVRLPSSVALRHKVRRFNH
jgi:hypothetical protein